MTQTYILSNDGDDLLDLITLEQAKAWLRVETEHDDTAIASLIASGAAEVEAYTGKVIMEQSATVICSIPRGGKLAFHRGPITSISSVEVLLEEGDPRILSEGADYVFDAGMQTIYFTASADLSGARQFAPIHISALIGYADSGSKKPPQQFITAVLNRVAECYENRDTAVELSAGIKHCVHPFKRIFV